MGPFQFYVLLGTMVFPASAIHISRLFDESVWSEVDKSPLQVQLLPSKNSSNAVEVIITNRGSKETYYLLSTEELMTKLQLYDSNDEPVAKVLPHHSDGQITTSPLPYQKLKSGASMARELDFVTKYDLSSGEQYYIQFGGFIPFYHEGQQPSIANSQSQIFEADVLPFTAPTQLPLKRYKHSSKTSMAQHILISNCLDLEMNAKLIRAIPHALEQAKKSLIYVKTGANRDTMRNFFKADDEATRKVISDRLIAIIKTLETRIGPGRVGCSDATGAGKRDHQICVKAGAVAMTDPQSGKMSICPASKRYAVEFKHCGDSNWGGNLIHEMTHSVTVFKPITQDITYTLQGCKSLSTARALQNANNFNFLADSAMQGKSC
jgi:deuterolysin